MLNRRHKAGIPLSASELELLFPNGYNRVSEVNELHDVNLEKSSSQAMHGYGSILKEKEKDIDALQSKSNMITSSSIALSDVQETNEDSTNMNSNSSSNSSLPWSSSSFMNQFEALKSKTLKSE